MWGQKERFPSFIALWSWILSTHRKAACSHFGGRASGCHLCCFIFVGKNPNVIASNALFLVTVFLNVLGGLPGDQPGADLGPLISPQAKERVCSLIQSGVDEGAKLVLDGRNVKVKGYENGNFVGPTIISGVTVRGLPSSANVNRNLFKEFCQQFLLCSHSLRWSATLKRSLDRCLLFLRQTPWMTPSVWSTRTPMATAQPSSPQMAPRRANTPMRWTWARWAAAVLQMRSSVLGEGRHSHPSVMSAPPAASTSHFFSFNPFPCHVLPCLLLT